jgi:hypothetical protein
MSKSLAFLLLGLVSQSVRNAFFCASRSSLSTPPELTSRQQFKHSGVYMRDYGKVHTSFWISDGMRRVSDDARLLALYLLTGQHTNMIGCFRLPDGYVSEDLNWEPERVSKGFDELSKNGFATRDSASKWVLILNFMRWNP